MANPLGDSADPAAHTATLPQALPAGTRPASTKASTALARLAETDLAPVSTASAEEQRIGSSSPPKRLIRHGNSPAHQHAVDRLAAGPRHACAEAIHGADAVHRHAMALARTAETELHIAIPAAGPCGDWKPEADLARPALTLQALCHDGARSTASTHLAGTRAQVRTAAELPPVLMISDRQTALIPLDADRPCAAAIYVRHPAIVGILADLFTRTWTHATPLDDIAPTTAAQITPAEQDVLQLLAAGLTDEAAARQLDISVRTIRRQVASLMDRLGTTSRFQAGFQAAKRGWL